MYNNSICLLWWYNNIRLLIYGESNITLAILQWGVVSTPASGLTWVHADILWPISFTGYGIPVGYRIILADSSHGSGGYIEFATLIKGSIHVYNSGSASHPWLCVGY